ncbi:MAG: Periplasmic chorismate mutase I precursor (EC [uncultured Paraburkholderia sp.]|nr:MAG: Periplasmic chorismate mutase I precursor (EC [uncultured Paraburkholderia sp.]CAH2916844.1 MAG: Periplasmic chorismate mutase I precursor (EC [uncultured Paraburkholderia sp.]
MNRLHRIALSCSLASLISCATLAIAPSPAFANGDDTALTNLIALASQRLALAEPVARWKWANHQAITDMPRENALLANVTQRAAAANVDPDFARAFFQDQIDASKEVQSALFASWRNSQPPSGPAPDLASSTRPQLDKLTQLMVAGLTRVQPLREAADCPSRVAQALANWESLTRYDSARSSALTHALGHVCATGSVGAPADSPRDANEEPCVELLCGSSMLTRARAWAYRLKY